MPNVIRIPKTIYAPRKEGETNSKRVGCRLTPELNSKLDDLARLSDYSNIIYAFFSSVTVVDLNAPEVVG